MLLLSEVLKCFSFLEYLNVYFFFDSVSKIFPFIGGWFGLNTALRVPAEPAPMEKFPIEQPFGLASCT